MSEGPVIDIAFAPTRPVLAAFSKGEVEDNARRFVASNAESTLRERMNLRRTPPQQKEEEQEEDEDDPYIVPITALAVVAGFALGALVAFLWLSR